MFQNYGAVGIDEVGGTIVAAPNGNLVVGGSSGLDAMVMMVTPQGDILWARQFANSDVVRQKIASLAITPDGDIVGIGNTEPANGFGRRDAFIFKISATGTLIWSKRETHPLDIFMDKVIALSANEYLVSCGYFYPLTPNLDVVLAKFDALGNLTQLSDRYDLAPSYYLDDPFGLISPNGVDTYVSGRLYADGGSPASMRPYLARFDANFDLTWVNYYLLDANQLARIYGTFLTASGNDLVMLTVGNRTSSQPEYSLGLIKTTAAGQLIWSREYDIPSSINEVSFGLVETNQGYCILGTVATADLVLVQTDWDGNLLWSKVIDRPGNLALESWTSAVTFSNGKIWVTGTENGTDAQIVLASIDQNSQLSCVTFQDIDTAATTIPPFQTASSAIGYQDSLPMGPGPTTLSLILPSICNGQDPDLGPDTAFCIGTLLLDATMSATASYLWQDGSTSATLLVTAPGNYWVQVTDDCCIYGDTIEIGFGLAGALGPDSVICNGSNVDLDAGQPGGSYLWSTGDTTQVITVSQAGLYSVTVSDSSGCSGIDSIVLTAQTLPRLDLGPDIERCGEDGVLLASPIMGLAYLWSTGATTSSIFADTTGIFGLRVLTECGTVSDSVQVNLIKDDRLFVPNVFSPNGDGNNDVFQCDGPVYEGFEMDIFDRWGRRLFSSHDILQAWDGNIGSNPCPEGIYFLRLRVLNCDRKLTNQSQAITLLR